MIKKRIRTYKTTTKLSVSGWRNSLVDEPAFIIGNAPSLKSLDLTLLTNRFTIGINRAFYKIDPTILIWQDVELWQSDKNRIPRTKCIKYCRDKADLQGKFYHFKLATGGYKLPSTAEMLYGRGSTGPLAFQLAHVLGCNPIVLLGMDCQYAKGRTDFYGKNPCHNGRTLINCKSGLEWIKKSKHRRTIINCSPNDVFEERKTLEESLAIIENVRPQSRKGLVARILGSV